MHGRLLHFNKDNTNNSEDFREHIMDLDLYDILNNEDAVIIEQELIEAKKNNKAMKPGSMQKCPKRT